MLHRRPRRPRLQHKTSLGKHFIEHRSYAWTARHVVLVSLVNGVNFLLILYGAIARPDISSYLLYVFIANLMVYPTYYITMKLVHKDSQWTSQIHDSSHLLPNKSFLEDRRRPQNLLKLDLLLL